MISMIVAMDAHRTIGYNNKLPWHIPEDLQNFKKITTNNVVVMGKITFESLPFKNGLPNRENIVVSKSFERDGIRTIKDINIEILKELEKEYNKEIIIIGGSSIYQQSFNYVDRVYLSLVYGCALGDSFFPDVDWSNFVITHREEKDQYLYKILDRCKK